MVAGQRYKRVGFVIQARMGSNRMPGKVLKPISVTLEKDVSILTLILNQLKKFEATIVVATSNLTQDDAIEQYCFSQGVNCYRGDELNVFSRFREIQHEYNFDLIYRITADNPVFDPVTFTRFHDYVVNCDYDYYHSLGLPVGVNFECFKSDLLRISDDSLTELEKEHVTIKFRSGDYQVGTYVFDEMTDLRLTVDEPKDFILIMYLFEVLGEFSFDLKNIQEFYMRNSWIKNINKTVRQK